MTPRSPTPIFGGHCDRYVVTVASPSAGVETPSPTRFGDPLYPPDTEPVRPSRGPEHRRRGIASRLVAPDPHVTSVDAVVPEAHLYSVNAPRRSIVTYVDRTLNCVDCGVEFIHSAADQEYYQQKGFVSDPKRCTSCRASRRASRDGGYDVRDIGGPRGYERGEDRPMREYFAVICSSCGNQAQVPFKPRMDRPVYCSDCFRTVKPD